MSENCRKCAGRLVAAKLQTLTELARLARFERATAWFVARYSIQLSYRRVEGAYYREEPVIRQGLIDREIDVSGGLIQARIPPATAPLWGTSSSTPGFMIPAGSRTFFAPLKASRNSGGTCLS